MFKHLFDSLTLTGTISQSGPGSNGNEGILRTPHDSRNRASSPDTVKCHPKTPFFARKCFILLQGIQ